MLICRLDSVNLEIIHTEYPKQLSQIQSVTSSTSDGAPNDSHPSKRSFLKYMYLPIDPTPEQVAHIEAAIFTEYEQVSIRKMDCGQ